MTNHDQYLTQAQEITDEYGEFWIVASEDGKQLLSLPFRRREYAENAQYELGLSHTKVWHYQGC